MSIICPEPELSFTNCLDKLLGNTVGIYLSSKGTNSCHLSIQGVNLYCYTYMTFLHHQKINNTICKCIGQRLAYRIQSSTKQRKHITMAAWTKFHSAVRWGKEIKELETMVAADKTVVTTHVQTISETEDGRNFLLLATFDLGTSS